MKMNCTQGELCFEEQVARHEGGRADLRHVLADDRGVYVASFVSAASMILGRALVSEAERDANAHLFVHAAEMLRLLLDQQAMHDGLATLTYDEAVRANVDLARRRDELLAKLRDAGVVTDR